MDRSSCFVRIPHPPVQSNAIFRPISSLHKDLRLIRVGEVGDLSDSDGVVAPREAGQFLCQMPAGGQKNAISDPLVSLTRPRHHVE
jgi:hypothetical protein